MRSALHVWHKLMFVILVCLLAGCGGKEGSSGGGSSPSSSSTAVTADRTDVTVASRFDDEGASPSELVNITLTPRQARSIETVTASSLPSWMQISLSVTSDTSAALYFMPQPFAPIGKHVLNFTLSGLDSKGRVVAAQSFTVRHEVIARLRFGVLSPTSLNTVAGGSAPTPVRLQIAGDGLQWQATSRDDRLSISPASGTGLTAIEVTLKNQSLASGRYDDAVIVRASDGQSLTIPISINLAKAALMAVPGTLNFGGELGRSFPDQSLTFSLNTGNRSWPWTLANIPAWVLPAATSGNVNATAVSVTMVNKPEQAAVGRTETTLQLSARVNDETVSLPVTAVQQLDRRRLIAASNGIALTASPAGTTLSRTVAISDNFGRQTTWRARSNQPWLAVTASGSTGTPGTTLTVTANTFLLPQNVIHQATVTITPDDASVAPETVQVALWNSTLQPAASTAITADYNYLVADPIRPLVYASRRGATSIDIYNSHTALLIGTITRTNARALAEMTVSGDGRRLYFLDTEYHAIGVIDLATRNLVDGWPLAAEINSETHILSVRPNGVEVILLSDGTSYLGSNGRFLTHTGMVGLLSASADGKTIYQTVEMFTPRDLHRYSLDYTEADGGKLVVKRETSVNSIGERSISAADLAVAADRSALYVPTLGPYECTRVNPDTLVLIAGLAGGDAFVSNIEISRDGRVACGLTSNNNTDLLLYRADGALYKSYNTGVQTTGTLLPRQMVFSSDGIMLAALKGEVRGAGSALLFFLPGR